MTMEAAAGKNPVSHVGKLYNVIAGRISSALVAELPGISSCTCRIVSRIGWPIDDPQIVDIELGLAKGFESGDRHASVLALVAEHFARASALQDELIERRVALF
jgi:S-adenosylmethionine synthetase